MIVVIFSGRQICNGTLTPNRTLTDAGTGTWTRPMGDIRSQPLSWFRCNAKASSFIQPIISLSRSRFHSVRTYRKKKIYWWHIFFNEELKQSTSQWVLTEIPWKCFFFVGNSHFLLKWVTNPSISLFFLITIYNNDQNAETFCHRTNYGMKVNSPICNF